MATRVALLLLLLVPSAVNADIYRWDNGQVIPGTQGITPQPYIDLSQWNTDPHNLRYADFSAGLNLSGVNFNDSWLDYAHFQGANLTYAKLHRSTLTQANLSAATVTGSNFAGLTSRGFTQAQLASTASVGARLRATSASVGRKRPPTTATGMNRPLWERACARLRHQSAASGLPQASGLPHQGHPPNQPE